MLFYRYAIEHCEIMYETMREIEIEETGDIVIAAVRQAGCIEGPGSRGFEMHRTAGASAH